MKILNQNTKFYKYLKKCAKEPINDSLLITKTKNCIIIDDKLNNIFQ